MQAPKTTEPKDRLAFDKWDQLGLRITLWAIALASVAGFVGIPSCGGRAASRCPFLSSAACRSRSWMPGASSTPRPTT